jgi:uncharacterized protein YmfQ (DUF2313 family)
MLAPLYAVTDYLWQFQRLLPRGRVWHRGWGTVQAEDLLTLMPQTVRLNQRAIDVLRETFPCSTHELLPEWEASLGLPDPCIGELDTTQQRQAAVCAKFTARGGQSVAYFTRLAASAGYTITITTFRPFYVSEGRVDDPLYDERWAYVWRINIATVDTLVYFRVGESAVDEPLVSFGDPVIECLLTAAKPAHTELIFSYVDGSLWDFSTADGSHSAWDNGASVWDTEGVAP